MIKRIVKMDVPAASEALFLDIFEDVKKEIRAQPGCLGLEVLRSEGERHMSIWTISVWESPDDLERYRSSSLFQSTWSRVKPLFIQKAQAWTLTPIETIV